MLNRCLQALDRRLIDDWHREAPRLWSVRIAAFWGALSGLAAVWPAFQGVLPLLPYTLLAMLIFAAIAVAKLTKQPGAE